MGMWIGAREGESGDRLGELAESELSSGGGVGGPGLDFAGTERERNLGIGRAEGAGEAWKVGPAYAAWILAGVVEGLHGACSPSVEGPWAPLGEKTRSMDGWDCVCFFVLRGRVAMCASSLGKTALSARAGFAPVPTLPGDTPTPLNWWLKPFCARFPRGFRCELRPTLAGGAWAGLWGGCCLPRRGRGEAVLCTVDDMYDEIWRFPIRLCIGDKGFGGLSGWAQTDSPWTRGGYGVGRGSE